MNTLQAIAFGAVQGVTEFLPISSTAHLILLPAFMGWEDPGLTFDVALHIGTILAILIYFATDLGRLAKAFVQSLFRRDPQDPYQRLSWMIVLGTVPAGVAGLLGEKWVESTLRSPYVIGCTLMLVAVAILAADRHAKEGKAWKELTFKDAILIGCGQACALIPGVSRSGSTMLVGLMRGLERSAAARVSFLLGTPITMASAVFKLKDLRHVTLTADAKQAMIVGIVSSGLIGYACIRFLLDYLARKPLKVFMLYRIALGALVIGLTLSGWLRPTPATTTVRPAPPVETAHR